MARRPGGVTFADADRIQANATDIAVTVTIIGRIRSGGLGLALHDSLDVANFERAGSFGDRSGKGLQQY